MMVDAELVGRRCGPSTRHSLSYGRTVIQPLWAGAKKREIWTTVVLRNRTKAFKVITVEEADKALAKSVSYKAPGRR